MQLHELLLVATVNYMVGVSKGIEFVEEFTYKDTDKCNKYMDAVVTGVHVLNEDMMAINVDIGDDSETEDTEMEAINIEETAQCITEILEGCGFDNIQDSSGYFIVKRFSDGTDRTVDVYKSTDGENPHYVIYCSYEDEESDYVSTEDLSVEGLVKKLQELSGD